MYCKILSAVALLLLLVFFLMLWSGLIRMAIASIFWFLLFSFLSFVFSAGDKTSAFFLVLFFFFSCVSSGLLCYLLVLFIRMVVVVFFPFVLL